MSGYKFLTELSDSELIARAKAFGTPTYAELANRLSHKQERIERALVAINDLHSLSIAATILRGEVGMSTQLVCDKCGVVIVPPKHAFHLEANDKAHYADKTIQADLCTECHGKVKDFILKESKS